MKSALLTLLLLLTFSSRAQAPTPVDMAKESHHHLLIENSYVRVFRFGLPAGESTLLHAHNKPYAAVSIGAAEPTARFRSVEQVIQAADQALYRAKQAGRNRVELSSAPRTAKPKRNIA